MRQFNPFEIELQLKFDKTSSEIRNEGLKGLEFDNIAAYLDYKETMTMSEKTLQIFELCQKLTELLGDKEAIADLKLLLERHPEMFRDKEEVREVIERVVSKPEIIINANKNNEDYTIIKAAKRLNNEKMADVVIKNEDGINEIFHTNKKRIREIERLKNMKNLLQVETPTPSTRQLNGLELIDNLSGANALSVIENKQIGDYKVLSTSANSIIPQKNNQSQALDMNDDSALKAIKDEMSNTKENEIQESENEKSKKNKETMTMSEKDTAQQKRENYIDKYSKTKAFKELDKDKQEAILSLKTLQAEPMPKGINTQELQNLITHFDNKHDKAQREFYLKFFEDTKQNPHIELNVLGKNGEQRKEYIKAYQHKESKDLYYIVITQENDNINITGYPTTKISKVINDIAKSENVARTLDEIAPPAKPIENNPSHQLANNIIPQKNNQSQIFELIKNGGGFYFCQGF